MNKLEKQGIGLIKYLAEIKHKRLLITDDYEFLCARMREIKKICKLLPCQKFIGGIDIAKKIETKLRKKKHERTKV